MTRPSTVEVLAVIQRLCDSELRLQRAIAVTDELVRDLGIDSLGAMILAVGLEDDYRIRLAEQDAGALVTVGDVVALVQRRCAEATDAAGP